MSLMGLKLADDDALMYRIYTYVCKLWVCAVWHAQKLDGLKLLALVVGLWDSGRKSNLVLDQCLFIYSVVVSMFNLE